MTHGEDGNAYIPYRRRGACGRRSGRSRRARPKRQRLAGGPDFAHHRAGADIPLIYSTYSGRGAATVVKSYYNLGLDKPMLVNFANTSMAFIAEIKDVMPKRLLGLTFRAAVPELVKDPADRARANAFKTAYEKFFQGEHVDELAVLMQFQGDALGAVLRNVADPTDPKAVKQYLETTPIRGVQTLRWSVQNHVALGSSDTIMVEHRGGVWAAADPLRK